MFSFIRKLSKRERSILYTCFFAFFCNGSLALMMGSAIPDLKAAYQLSDTLSGLFLSAHSIGNLIAGFISGIVPLYLGQKKSILLLSSLAFIGFTMMIVWGNPVWLFLAFVFTGLGRGSVTNFDNRMVNQISGGSPVGTNLLHSCFAVGAILTPLIFLTISRCMGWRAAVGVVVLFGCVSLFNLSRMKLQQDHLDRLDKTNSTVCFLKNPSFLILAMMMFCYLCSEYAINGWLVTYIQNKESLLLGFGKTGDELTAAVKAYSQSMATLLWSVMLAGRLFCAWLSGHVHQKLLMMVSSFGVAAFYGLLLVSSTIPMATVCVAGLGFCMAGICPMIYSDAAIFTNTYPLATSFILGIGSGGAILMPTVVGSLAERFGFTGGMSAIFVTIVLLVVFSVLNVTVKTRMPKEYQAQA
ncbi:MAG: MFS transporter [Clostridia bacterium]|nr:MFS transporter [Clostridia bacterium]MDD6039753.1 MFS transporter [Clostridia bacterium]